MILAGVLGDPIGHSLSPRLHRHWLARHGIDGAYLPLRVARGDLADALRLLPRMGFAGCNVTLPLKADAMALADAVTDRARRAGAVNTLTFERGIVRGDNTDGAGFLANLRAGSDWRPDRPALVLGAGGAARGVVDALLAAGVPEVRLANRTRMRADALARMDARIRVVDWPGDAVGAGLVVNATSLGMTGQPPLAASLEGLAADAVVTDLVYAPLETRLLAQARARGNPVVDGLGMLLHQAVPGFAAWFGTVPVVNDALRRAVLA